MAFRIEELRRPAEGSMWTSPARICVTAEGEPCDCEDPRARRLLVGKGSQIPATVAAEHGLLGAKERKQLEDKQLEPEGDKAAAADPNPAPPPAKGPKSLSKMNRGELVAVAEEAGLDASGTNAEIAERIRAARKAQPEGAKPEE